MAGGTKSPPQDSESGPWFDEQKKKPKTILGAHPILFLDRVGFLTLASFRIPDSAHGLRSTSPAPRQSQSPKESVSIRVERFCLLQTGVKAESPLLLP
jgi:hypothetical protein